MTFYPTKDKSTTVSAFQMYEIHTTQENTEIHPGQTYDLDYSVAHVFRLQEDLHLQAGLVGYGQWQTTDKTGPSVTPEQGSAHYTVQALGFASNLILPNRRTSLGLKYFEEIRSRSTFKGYSLQISGAVSF